MNSYQTEFEGDNLAVRIADMWQTWDDSRNEWKADKQELRNYLFATDTKKTSNSKLPWCNSTVSPKLTQIRDNLHANYMAALFPSENWFYWESTDKNDDIRRKRQAILNYMKQKMKASNFQLLISKLIYDYIDYGNVFAAHEYVKDVVGTTVRYIGPKAYRIDPHDLVMNVVADEFSKTPIVRRVLKGLGDFLDDLDTKPYLGYDKAVVARMMAFRRRLMSDAEMRKSTNLSIDGFGSIDEYLKSDIVEILEFWGNIYDPETQKLHKNVIITVVDRMWVLRKKENDNWIGGKPMYHCGWRLKPDNLWAQGPLDQLVGLQYRIDHLENMKADVWDMIAYPMLKVTGNTVDEFEYAPGEMIFTGDEGDVSFVAPDGTALNADIQIQELMNRMEELAGAPKQAMGIRTPGEKTKYEVQTLENAAGRIFQSKVSWFERNILEPLLNGMLADAVANFEGVERIRSVDEEFGTELFETITKEDLMATGKLYPMGARHFAEQAKFVQELAQTMQLVQALPSVAAHISGKAVAKALEENMGWLNYGIVKDNAQVVEAAETQRLMNTAAEDIQVEANIDTEGPMDEDMPPEAQA